MTRSSMPRYRRQQQHRSPAASGNARHAQHRQSIHLRHHPVKHEDAEAARHDVGKRCPPIRPAMDMMPKLDKTVRQIDAVSTSSSSRKMFIPAHLPSGNDEMRPLSGR